MDKKEKPMEINFIDAISEEKAHCGNCKHWNNTENFWGECPFKTREQPSFGVCKNHEFIDES